MNIKLILGVLALVTSLIFSVQNAGLVEVTFIAWHFSTSLALILFVALATGLIGGWAITSATQKRKTVPEKPLHRESTLDRD